MPAPGGVIWGSQKAIDTLKSNPANAGARVEWTPARVGLSADGRHGFTAGYMTIHRADGTAAPGKYLVRSGEAAGRLEGACLQALGREWRRPRPSRSVTCCRTGRLGEARCGGDRSRSGVARECGAVVLA